MGVPDNTRVANSAHLGADELMMQNLREPASQALLEKSQAMVLQKLRQKGSDGSTGALGLDELDSHAHAPNQSSDGTSGNTGASGAQDSAAAEIFGLYVTEGTRCMDVYSFTAFIESFDNSVTPQTAKSIFTTIAGSARAQLEETKFTNWLINTYPDFNKTWGMS